MDLGQIGVYAVVAIFSILLIVGLYVTWVKNCTNFQRLDRIEKKLDELLRRIETKD